MSTSARTVGSEVSSSSSLSSLIASGLDPTDLFLGPLGCCCEPCCAPDETVFDFLFFLEEISLAGPADYRENL